MGGSPLGGLQQSALEGGIWKEQDGFGVCVCVCVDVCVRALGWGGQRGTKVSPLRFPGEGIPGRKKPLCLCVCFSCFNPRGWEGEGMGRVSSRLQRGEPGPRMASGSAPGESCRGLLGKGPAPGSRLGLKGF